MNIKQLYRVLSILLIIAFVCISFILMFVFIAHTCCMPSDCIPCLSLAKIQEIVRQYGITMIIFAGILTVLLFLQYTTVTFPKTYNTTNLVYMKARLNN